MDQKANVPEETSTTTVNASLSQPHWHLLFLLIGAVILLLIGVAVRFALGFSVADDRVFALEALAAGILAERVIRRFWHRRLTLSKRVPVPFLFAWVALCAYVFIARPFE